MTWHRDPWGALRIPVLAATSLGLTVACGGGGDDRVLRVIKPADGAELSMADDTDPSTPGLQCDVEVESEDLISGTPLLLFVGGEQVAIAELGGSSDLTFESVTLPPGDVPIYVTTTTGSVSSDEDQHYIFRQLEIASPEAGDLDAEDDVDATTAGIQVRVEVNAYGVEGDVQLLVDGEEAAEQSVVGQSVTFEVTLEPGEHELVATGEDDLMSEPVVVTVAAGGCAQVSVVSPVATDGGNSVTLGGSDGTCPESGMYKTTVELATAIDEGTRARLYVNNATTWVPSEVGADGSIIFTDVPLELRDSANTLYVVFETDTTCREDLDLEILVDCDGPDCTIVAPEPFAGVDENNEAIDYINSNIDNDGFDLTVRTTAEDGREVKLIVDGEEVDYTRSDDGADAVFAVPALADGAHTFQAECVDGSGNVSATTEKTWLVDLTPCDLTIDDPSEGQLLGEGDDEDLAADGLMINIKTTVSGEGCGAEDDVYSRVSLCDPNEGIGEDVAFEPYVSELGLDLTVQDMMSAQNVCVEIRDRAGNVSASNVGVVTASAPALLPIVSVDSTSATYRADPLALSWVVPSDLDPTYTNYQFRCHVRALPEEASESDLGTWWMQARYHVRADGSSRFTADAAAEGAVLSTTGTYDMPTGSQPLYCAMRLCNDTSECTTPSASTLLEKPFRETLVSEGESGLSNLGSAVVPLGDVDGDNRADVLVTAAFPGSGAARSGAVLYLSGGTIMPISQVVDLTTNSFERDTPLGYRAAGLGDVNGDSVNDFAISFPGLNSDLGVVYIFFGRLAGDDWPASVDLDTGCGADICISLPEGTLASFGGGLAGVGDFDGVPPNDIAISAQLASNLAGSLYVLLGDADEVKCADAACAARGGDFFGEARVVTETGPFRGFILTDDSDFSFLGSDVIAAGKSEGGGDTTDDLLFVRTPTEGELYRINGRAYTAGTGLQTIAFSEAALVMTGAFNYNTRITLAGDIWSPEGAPASMEGMSDLALHFSGSSNVRILPGDSAAASGFSSAATDVLRIVGAGATNMGDSICSGEVPALGWTNGTGTDLDNDGVQDLCAGGAPTPGAGLAASENADGFTADYNVGQAFYFVGDLLQSATSAPENPTTEPSINAYAVDPANAGSTYYPITPSQTASEPDEHTGIRTVQIVGDVNGDGRADVMVGDVPLRNNQRSEVPTAGFDNQGGFSLLY